MALALKAIGGNVETFLPKRLDEGYGMSDEAVVRMLGDFPGVELVVTVDNGINSISQIADLRSEGIETIVTDHHLPSVNMFGQPLRSLIPRFRLQITCRISVALQWRFFLRMRWWMRRRSVGFMMARRSAGRCWFLPVLPPLPM